MEIAPLPRRRSVSLRVQVLLAVAVLAPVTLLVVLPTLFSLERYVITSDSMGSSIGRGSVAFERIVPVSDLEVGDVITYPVPPGYGEDGLVTHRIISMGHGFVRTQGDANPRPDPWPVPMPGPTQERVAFHVPFLGYPFLASLGRVFWTVVLLTPAIGLVSARALGQVRRRRLLHQH